MQYLYISLRGPAGFYFEEDCMENMQARRDRIRFLLTIQPPNSNLIRNDEHAENFRDQIFFGFVSPWKIGAGYGQGTVDVMHWKLAFEIARKLRKFARIQLEISWCIVPCFLKGICLEVTSS